MSNTEENPLRRAAIEAEGVLLMRAENDYLKQRAIALNVQVRTLSAEVKRLAAEVERLTPEDAEEAPETETDNPEGD